MKGLKLLDTPDSCDVITIPGWSNFGWLTCTDEIKKMNRSKRDMAVAGAAVVLGELLEVGEAVDFTGAAVGKGFWRKMKVAMDMSAFDGTWKNNSGSINIDQKFKVNLSGMSPATMEWVLSLMGCCGISIVAPDKDGDTWELGNKLSPCKMESAKLKNDKDGKYIEAEFSITYPPRRIDTTLFPMDEVPN